jgi:hypothetical protein
VVWKHLAIVPIGDSRRKMLKKDEVVAVALEGNNYIRKVHFEL